MDENQMWMHMRIAGGLGAGITAFLCVTFLFIMVREFVFFRVRVHPLLRVHKYFTLRRSIRLLCVLWAVLEAPSYHNTIMGVSDTHSTTTSVFYCCHILAQSSLYSAFCCFGVLWFELMRFSPRVIRYSSHCWKSMGVVLDHLTAGVLIYSLSAARCTSSLAARSSWSCCRKKTAEGNSLGYNNLKMLITLINLMTSITRINLITLINQWP